MPNAFNFNASPFDCLTQEEQRLIRDSVDVVYFPKGAAILEVGIARFCRDSGVWPKEVGLPVR